MKLVLDSILVKKNNLEGYVYNEEYKSITEELGEVRKKRLVHDKVNESKEGLKQRFDEILHCKSLMKKYLMRWLRRLIFSHQRILFLS